MRRQLVPDPRDSWVRLGIRAAWLGGAVLVCLLAGALLLLFV